MYDMCQSSSSFCQYTRKGIEEKEYDKLKVNTEFAIEIFPYLVQNNLAVFRFGGTETHIQ